VRPRPADGGAWQHLAVVCDGAEAVLYLDGAEKARGPALGPLVPNKALPFRLGQGYASGRFFNGQLSDVRVVRKALSAGEVAALARETPKNP
jgi:hypothetical protein